MRDVFVQKAKSENYRSRAAFKFIEINEKYNLLSSAHNIIDLGAAPGGWSQVISRYIDQNKAKVENIVAVDLLKFAPLPHVTQIIGDFTNIEIQHRIISQLHSSADLIISDMAPSTTGNQQTDHLRIMSLLDDTLLFVDEHLSGHGNFVAKIFQGGSERTYVENLRKIFKKVSFCKPKASRSESVEIYLVALDRIGHPSPSGNQCQRGENIFQT